MRVGGRHGLIGRPHTPWLSWGGRTPAHHARALRVVRVEHFIPKAHLEILHQTPSRWVKTAGEQRDADGDVQVSAA